MSEKNLVVCDKEFRYANGLGENITERSELALRVHTCTSLESLQRFRQDRKVHILIIDEAFAYEERSKMEAEQTFVLTKDGCKDLGEREKEVGKYQSADRILSVVFQSYYENTKQNILKTVRKSQRTMYAVYSPIHRIGRTAFAIALGKELAKKEKTLYLNLEEYADVDGRFMRAEGRNLGDLLYYMRQEENNMALRLSTMIGKIEDLDYVPPMLVSTDLKEVSYQEWSSFLEAILEESAYENVILDLSESVQGLFHILQLCHRIYMPILDDAISKRKLSQYESGLRQMGMGKLEEKTHRFAMPKDIESYVKKIIQEGD